MVVVVVVVVVVVAVVVVVVVVADVVVVVVADGSEGPLLHDGNCQRSAPATASRTSEPGHRLGFKRAPMFADAPKP